MLAVDGREARRLRVTEADELRENDLIWPQTMPATL